jgi:putative heme-binding domain-containing protein
LVDDGCLKCHRFAGSGAPIGPDLSHVGRRYDARMILESILEPSRVMDPKYRHTIYVLEDGRVVTGRPIGVQRDEIVVETDPQRHTTVTVARQEITEGLPSQTSPMPTGLVDVLTAEELLDLLALLKYHGMTGSEELSIRPGNDDS